jgi:hypothetical protein
MKQVKILITTLVCLAGVSCSGSSDSGPTLAVPPPTVEGPVLPTSDIVLQATSIPPAEVGYTDAEFFVSGTARAFRNVGDLDSDGNWTVEEANQSGYRTRIVVRRPIDPADFNGVVFVEWLNVSAGFDSSPDWIYGHVELIRRGYAFIGVSAQLIGIEGTGGPGPIPGLDFSLKNADPERYGSLVHPGDSYSYDIFSQVGRAIRDREGVDPLQGLVAESVIAAGESQSAFRMVTYINSFADSAQIFDGYLVHSRGGGSAPLSQEPEPAIATPEVTRIRRDLNIPVLTLQAETDLTVLGSWPDRQEDTPYFRWWEVAGTAHADIYTLLTGAGDRGDDPSVADVVFTAAPIPGIIECDNPINSGPHHFVLKAGIHALTRWVVEGIAPASSPLLELAGDPPEFLRDELGNTRGGIRTPYVDVPVAQLLGDPPGGSSFCFLFGKSIPLDEATLDRLYPDHETYVSAVEASAQATVDAGFLLSEDAELIVSSAQNSRYGQ